jgi:hypothetical protein
MKAGLLSIQIWIANQAVTTKSIAMKTLILPFGILLLTACSKRDMPQPATADGKSHWPTAMERRTGDTVVKISVRPFGKGPVPSSKEPVIKK